MIRSLGLWSLLAIAALALPNSDGQKSGYMNSVDKKRLNEVIPPCKMGKMIKALGEQKLLLPDVLREQEDECLYENGFQNLVFLRNIDSTSVETSQCVQPMNEQLIQSGELRQFGTTENPCRLIEILNKYYCEARTVCLDHTGADVVYSVGYVLQQLSDNTTEPLNCPKARGHSAQMGSVINPDAYLPGFNRSTAPIIIEDFCIVSADETESTAPTDSNDSEAVGSEPVGSEPAAQNPKEPKTLPTPKILTTTLSEVQPNDVEEELPVEPVEPTAEETNKTPKKENPKRNLENVFPNLGSIRRSIQTDENPKP